MPLAAQLADLRDDILDAAEHFVKDKFRDHDPSHDWHHVHRVRQLALRLANDAGLPRQPNGLVLELGALFHDLCDAKYLPANATAASTSAKAVLEPFFTSLKQLAVASSSSEGADGAGSSSAGAEPSALEQLLPPQARATIERIVDNVSWSKDERRRKERNEARARGDDPRDINAGQEGEQMDWEEECVEFWCVSDADRLDAIGSIGILRCAAYSAIKNKPLHIPPANAQNDSRPPAEQAQGWSDSAIAHFYLKLRLIRGERLRTETARMEAERRQAAMQSFLDELDLECLVGQQGEELFRMQQDLADVDAATRELEVDEKDPSA